jgi:hypothetical protein
MPAIAADVGLPLKLETACILLNCLSYLRNCLLHLDVIVTVGCRNPRTHTVELNILAVLLIITRTRVSVGAWCVAWRILSLSVRLADPGRCVMCQLLCILPIVLFCV